MAPWQLNSSELSLSVFECVCIIIYIVELKKVQVDGDPGEKKVGIPVMEQIQKRTQEGDNYTVSGCCMRWVCCVEACVQCIIGAVLSGYEVPTRYGSHI